MAGSVINSIFDAIAGWDVYYDSDVPPKVKELQNLDDTLKTAEGVVRVITLQNGDQAGEFVALGKTMAIDWTIIDTLYVRPTAHLGALRNSIPQLTNYVVNYIDAIKNDRSPTNQSHIENWSASIGTESYPEGTSEDWFTATITLTVREFIN